MSHEAVIHSLLLIAIMAVVTLLLRSLPFLVFSKGTPKAFQYLSQVLPFSIMAMLVVYCLKNTSILAAPHGIPELIAVALVVVLHKWRHNTLLSIVCGTVCYMLLVQLVF